MSDKPSMDKDRRNWLIATSAVGGVGAAAALLAWRLNKAYWKDIH